LPWATDPLNPSWSAHCEQTGARNAEAFGISIAEAQSCGVPAVTTAVGTGTEQTVADGISGRVVPPNDPRALAEALAWCLQPSRTAALRAAARAHAETHLNAHRMVDAVCRVYSLLSFEGKIGVR
jgi:glycosyltransferase involved in cell wall biosynthesis